ncbi:uncharacterized protein LOC128367126 [Scomber japonicus]|uniref:uncharacterized protein LOC128367126 n=1 Tax=Scomber japonicus TaxID=13676 RepID=UPI002304F7C8|nr:uncharacterized protein LOC128367126 [Scomber japonicus]
MDLRIVVTISTLLLMTIESDQTVPNITTFTTPTNNTTDSSSSSPCTCPTTSPKTTATPSTSSSAPALDLITIKWTENCKGEVLLILNYTSNSPVCYDNKTKVQSLLGNVCKNKKDCEDPPKWERSMTKTICYHLTESMRKEERKYETLKVQCTVGPDVQGQLQGYKVVTALLCCVLLVLLLMRFTRPTVKALQKRLSDRRQNRWIGPTQSHSVSYHRGKTAVKNNDGEKRLSYPALERLTVSDSREPSSNRNSGYNL